MEDNFELPVIVNGREVSFPVRLLQYGYAFKLEVEIEGTNVFFELDEERNWRAMLSYEDLQSNKKLNMELLQAIGVAMEALMK